MAMVFDDWDIAVLTDRANQLIAEVDRVVEPAAPTLVQAASRQPAWNAEVAELQQRCFKLDEAAELIEEYGQPGNLAAVYSELDEAEKALYAAQAAVRC